MEGFTQKTTKMEAVKEAAKWLNTAAPAKLKRASRKRKTGWKRSWYKDDFNVKTCQHDHPQHRTCLRT